METQEDTVPPSQRFVDDLDQRLLEIFALAKEHFRTAGLTYSEKLHQFFVDLGGTPAPSTESSDEEVETSAKTES